MMIEETWVWTYVAKLVRAVARTRYSDAIPDKDAPDGNLTSRERLFCLYEKVHCTHVQ